MEFHKNKHFFNATVFTFINQIINKTLPIISNRSQPSAEKTKNLEEKLIKRGFMLSGKSSKMLQY